MSDRPSDGPADAVRRLEIELGLHRLRPAWAKCEILLGLACVWLSFQVERLVDGASGATASLTSLGLFALGGYLAMAGSRSHLYQSANRLTAYLADRLPK